MNLYLDIDGVLIKDGRPANGLQEFLEYATEHFNCYWLTTHCRNGGNRVAEHLKNFLPNELLVPTEKIQPRDWITLKTEAIDFSQPFLWLDDYLPVAEKRVLEQNNSLANFVKIELQKNTNQLQSVIIQLDQLLIDCVHLKLKPLMISHDNSPNSLAYKMSVCVDCGKYIDTLGNLKMFEEDVSEKLGKEWKWEETYRTPEEIASWPDGSKNTAYVSYNKGYPK